jgi:hypothetical protein
MGQENSWRFWMVFENGKKYLGSRVYELWFRPSAHAFSADCSIEGCW